MSFNKKARLFFLYPMGILAAAAAIPMGSAVKDYGLVHTTGMVIAFFVCAGVYWEIFGGREPKRGDLRK